MPAGLGKAIRETAVTLRNALAGAGGIPTSLEPGQVQLPGAWVSFVSAEPTTMSAYTLRYHVYLIAPEGGTMQTLDILGDLLPKALDVIAPEEPVTATTVTLPSNPTTPLPAYRLVVDELADIEE